MARCLFWYSIHKDGLGWQDIVIKYNITCPRRQHQVRELVVHGRETRTTDFDIEIWRDVSGFHSVCRLSEKARLAEARI